MFRFEIKRVDYLPAADIWALTGKLLKGETENNSAAFVETDNHIKKIKIETVAFVDPPNLKAEKLLTLTVKNNGKNLQDLADKILSSTLVKEELQTV